MKILIAALFSALLVITLMVYHWRPLIPSGLRASYVEGQSTRGEARVYRMLFRSQVFIELPERGNVSGQWFAVDLDRRTVVSPTVPPGRSPYLHFNHDMNLGVPVDDTVKGSGDWQVTWGDGQVAWSNGDLTVQLEGA